MVKHMTRRGFVGAAAGAAVASVGAGVVGAAMADENKEDASADNSKAEASAEAAPEEPQPDSGVMRVCISVNNLEKSLGFFSNMLEYTQVGAGILLPDEVSALYGLEGGARYAMGKNDYQSTVIQLIEFEARTGACIREGRNGYDPGYFDVAMRCDDNKAVHKHLTKLGYTYYCEPYEYSTDWSDSTVCEAVLCGIDGVPTTMIETVSEPRPEFDGLFKNITDIALVVSDMDVADTFWTEVLGLPKVYDEDLTDGLVDPIMGLPEGTHSRMVYYAGTNTPVIEALQFSAEGTSLADVAKPENAGIFAMSYIVDDVDAVAKKATDAGFTVHGDPVECVLAVFGRVRSVLIDGPDGMLAEVFQQL